MIAGDGDRRAELARIPNESCSAQKLTNARALCDITAERDDVIALTRQQYFERRDQIGTSGRGEMKIAGLKDPERPPPVRAAIALRRRGLTRACQ